MSRSGWCARSKANADQAMEAQRRKAALLREHPTTFGTFMARHGRWVLLAVLCAVLGGTYLSDGLFSAVVVAFLFLALCAWIRRQVDR